MSLSVHLAVLMTVTHHVSLLTKSVMTLWTVLEEKMNQMIAVLMEVSAWWVVEHHLKAEWSTASLEYGVRCVMILGGLQMQLLCVVDWDSQLKVWY